MPASSITSRRVGPVIELPPAAPQPVKPRAKSPIMRTDNVTMRRTAASSKGSIPRIDEDQEPRVESMRECARRMPESAIQTATGNRLDSIGCGARRRGSSGRLCGRLAKRGSHDAYPDKSWPTSGQRTAPTRGSRSSPRHRATRGARRSGVPVFPRIAGAHSRKRRGALPIASGLGITLDEAFGDGFGHPTGGAHGVTIRATGFQQPKVATAVSTSRPGRADTVVCADVHSFVHHQ